jgi:hypothetical protein
LLSTELQLAIAPARTYGRLVDNGEGGRAGALAPIAFSALATGLTVAFLASRWASVELVATTASSWGFTLALQLVGACAVILPGQRRVGLPRAFELFFLGHAPWTLWMLAVGALAIAGRGAFGAITAVILSGLLPTIWTAVIVAAFSRTVLDAGRVGAWLRALVHLLLIWAFALAYIAWAAGGWMRIVEALTQ